jgi:hypothetical protein
VPSSYVFVPSALSGPNTVKRIEAIQEARESTEDPLGLWIGMRTATIYYSGSLRVLRKDRKKHQELTSITVSMAHISSLYYFLDAWTKLKEV